MFYQRSKLNTILSELLRLWVMGLKPLVSWMSRLGPGEGDLFAHRPSAHH